MASDPTFITQRLSYAVSVIGFGADPTGMTDSGPAFAAAIKVCRERNYSTLHIPAGTYRIASYSQGSGNPSFLCDANTVGLCLNFLSALCIRGDGAYRGGGGHQTGTTIVFDLPAIPTDPLLAAIGIKGSSVLRIENLTIEIAPTSFVRDGVWISTVDGASTTAIQFQNVRFRWCDVAVKTLANNNNSELAFYDCDFTENKVGFQSLWGQALVQKFVGCIGGGNAGPDADNDFQAMETMFDLFGGGNITVIGFGGKNIATFLKAGPGGGNIGYNLFHNIRLEQIAEDESNTWGNVHRTKIYDAIIPGGASRNQFDGLVVTPPAYGTPADDGTPRFSLLNGHDVVLRNAAGGLGSGGLDYPLATSTSKLLAFSSISTRGGMFRCYNVSVPLDARLNRDDVPALGRYSFEEGNTESVPYPNLLHPPLYGPNYSMSVEYHCWAVGDALNGVVASQDPAPPSTTNQILDATPSDTSRFGVIECRTTDEGHATLISDAMALKPGGGTWRFQCSARVTATPTGMSGNPEFEVRLGFGDDPADDPENGVYFRYRNNANGGRWEGVIRWNATMTPGVLDTMEDKDEEWHTFEIELNAAGDTAVFYIDGLRKGTASLTPTSPGPTGLMPLQFVRTGGDGTKSAEIDYYKYEVRPTTVGQMYPE